MGRALMIQGTTSAAGKSLLVTALCRYFADRGVRVAPFKAQNMSNNARVVQGGEIGSAQYFQALAARAVPEVRMNPVLLKPEADTRSQVVVLGRADLELSRLPWRARAARLWPVVRRALRELLDAYDLVLIEGAGSPAEINLQDADIVNMRVAHEAQAPVLLVADIDRGGAFAHLYGTWALLPPEDRVRLKGFVLNKFRGDPALLEPGPAILEARTGVPVVGVLPWVAHALPDEDAVRFEAARRWGAAGRVRVALVVYPRVSNVDEFKPLEALADLRLARRPEDLEGAELVILPGSKHVAQDLAWLRRSGLAEAVRAKARAGVRVLGVCGGLQMLGERVQDPWGVEGAAEGLGLLPLVTEMRPEKTLAKARARFAGLEAPWAVWEGLEVAGYEIHHGRTRSVGPVAEVLPGGRGFARGNVLGVYLHGLFENPSAVRALFGAVPPDLEATFAALARWVAAHLDPRFLEALVTEEGGRPLSAVRRLIVLLGGARSGKSQKAEEIARALGGDAVSVIVTAEAGDAEMRERIARHRAQRNPNWEVLEATRDVAGALERARHGVVVLDCATLWVSNLLLEAGEAAARREVAALLAAWRKGGKTLIVVTNEVGMGVVPANALARRYRDLLGWVNQRLVAAADEAYLMVAGAMVPLEGRV